ncbi:hypothetical protein D3C77_346570 [compost metagenome]
MNDLIMMGMIQRISDLRRNANGLVNLQWCTLLDDFIQILAFHIFHDNIMNIIFLSYIIDAYYVGMR